METSTTLRRRGPQPLRRALGLLVVSTACVTAAVIVLLADLHPDLAPLLGSFALVGFANVAVGAIAWDRRPSNGMGLLLVITGFLTLAAAAGNVQELPIVIVGSMLAEAPIGALLHLLLAFPSGQLRGRVDRALVLAGYLITVGLQVVRTMISAEPPWLFNRPDLDPALDRTQGVSGAVVLVAAALLMITRLRSTRRTPAERRSLAIVYGYGIGTIVWLPFSASVLAPAFDLSVLTLFATQLAIFAASPFVLAYGVLRGGFARTTEIAELGIWLGSSREVRPPLREALAATLGDPSLELLFRRHTDAASPESPWVDPAGRAVSAIPSGEERGLVEIDGPTAPAAVIGYDTTLIANPEQVRSAGRVVAVELERERLTADLIASREAVRESRGRLVEVADAERRRVAQDLHDLLQSRLILAALHAGALAKEAGVTAAAQARAATLRTELDDGITELRRLVHGMMPALLVERGLYAAAEDLVDRQPLPTDLDLTADDRPVPPAVASTCYFILAEALSNAVKHAHATRVSVQLRRTEETLQLRVRDDGVGGARLDGHGLRGLADRADALGGTLAISSSADTGTAITVDLPCGSDAQRDLPLPGSR